VYMLCLNFYANKIIIIIVDYCRSGRNSLVSKVSMKME
jgi:hypothetical protein